MSLKKLIPWHQTGTDPCQNLALSTRDNQYLRWSNLQSWREIELISAWTRPVSAAYTMRICVWGHPGAARASSASLPTWQHFPLACWNCLSTRTLDLPKY